MIISVVYKINCSDRSVEFAFPLALLYDHVRLIVGYEINFNYSKLKIELVSLYAS